jgi:transcription-repair coupling factor (superfamily II helicase)
MEPKEKCKSSCKLDSSAVREAETFSMRGGIVDMYPSTLLKIREASIEMNYEYRINMSIESYSKYH